LAIAAIALTLGMLVMVVILGNLERGGWASLKIRGEEGRYRSDFLKITKVR
jgi:hypothetical protein